MKSRWFALHDVVLAQGAHAPGHTYCVLEAVNYVAGLPWSDSDASCGPAIGAFCRTWNDTPEPHGPVIRARLKTYIPRLVGARGTPAQEQKRAWLAGDWLIRTALVAALRTAGLAEHADTLATLPPQTSITALRKSGAVRAAAEAAAGEATGEAAWTATWVAAGEAAWQAAWTATWAAAGEATGEAAWTATWAATWAAAGEATGESLSGLVAELQTSAWDLLDRMLAVGARSPHASLHPASRPGED